MLGEQSSYEAGDRSWTVAGLRQTLDERMSVSQNACISTSLFSGTLLFFMPVSHASFYLLSLPGGIPIRRFGAEPMVTSSDAATKFVGQGTRRTKR